MGRSPWTASAQKFDRRLVVLLAAAVLLALIAAVHMVRVAVRPGAPPLGAPAGRTVPMRTVPPSRRVDPRPSPHIEHAALDPPRAANPPVPPPSASPTPAPQFVPVPVMPVPTEKVADDEELLRVTEPDPTDDHHAHER